VIEGLGRYGVSLSVTDDLGAKAVAAEGLGYSAIGCDLRDYVATGPGDTDAVPVVDRPAT
jgi:hypothetical protein